MISNWKEGRNRSGFLPPYVSVKNPNLHLTLPLKKSLVCHFYWSFIFDYLKVDTVMFINYFFVYVYCNHKNYLIGGGEVKLLFERLASGWSDKSSFTSSPKSNRYTQRNLRYTLQTVYKSYPQIEWQIAYFLVQSYLKLGKKYIFL